MVTRSGSVIMGLAEFGYRHTCWWRRFGGVLKMARLERGAVKAVNLVLCNSMQAQGKRRALISQWSLTAAANMGLLRAAENTIVSKSNVLPSSQS